MISPTPWKLHRNINGVVVGIDDANGNTVIMQTFGMPNTDNMNLMSAAPDLYAALVNISKGLSAMKAVYRENDGTVHDTEQLLVQARQALKKAGCDED